MSARSRAGSASVVEPHVSARRVPSSAYSVMTTVPSSRKTASEYAPPNGVGPSARSTLTRRRGAPGRPAPAASCGATAAGRFRVALKGLSELDAVLGNLLVERSRNELTRATVPSRLLVRCLTMLRQGHDPIAEALRQRNPLHLGLGDGGLARTIVAAITRARHGRTPVPIMYADHASEGSDKCSVCNEYSRRTRRGPKAAQRRAGQLPNPLPPDLLTPSAGERDLPLSRKIMGMAPGGIKPTCKLPCFRGRGRFARVRRGTRSRTSVSTRRSATRRVPRNETSEGWSGCVSSPSPAWTPASEPGERVAGGDRDGGHGRRAGRSEQHEALLDGKTYDVGNDHWKISVVQSPFCRRTSCARAGPSGRSWKSTKKSGSISMPPSGSQSMRRSQERIPG